MALVICGKTTCKLCDDVLEEGADIVMTSHFIADEKDPLWCYSDAAMHKSCFLAWEHRLAFISKFNEIVRPVTFGNGTYHQMMEDGSVAVLKRSEV